MNLNLKLDVDEEQTLQYVNKLAFNIPSGATAFNLNIVNPSVGNQSYILNPVGGVGQGMVTYQPSVAFQSYVAVPAEAENNIIHNLPVGVPVPIELPVSAGLMQNHCFESSGVIIENDCSTAAEIFKPFCPTNSENDLKIDYAEKPEEKSTIDFTNEISVQTIGYNFSGRSRPDWAVKKPCPLEMSIKAANIDVEFDKCETETLKRVQPVISQNLPLENECEEESLKNSSLLILNNMNSSVKPSKTEITWDNNNDKEVAPIEDFQESLICEVEEVNDEDEDEYEDGESGSDEPKARQGKKKEIIEEIISSEESDAVPLSFALKLKKVSSHKNLGFCKNKKRRKEEKRVKNKSEEPLETESNDDREWSESDDDVLNSKRIKSEFNYESLYKKPTSMFKEKNGEPCRKFSRVRSCCSKRECAKIISIRDQKFACQNFFSLESDEKKNVYLMNCIEHVCKSKNLEKESDKSTEAFNSRTEEKKIFVNENMQLEIENESNGNQKLSDEIQNAIQESLKDCMANELGFGGGGTKARLPEEEKSEKNTWNFYVTVDGWRTKVCLQFLLKLFQIPKSRVKSLQKKILSGSPTAEESVNANQKLGELWQVAKSHLDDLPGEECLGCEAEPKHRRLPGVGSKEDLFADFKKYYFEKIGREPNVKFNSYKRFIDKKSQVSFSSKSEETCVKCEDLKKQELKKKKTEKLFVQTRNSRSNLKREKNPGRRDSGSLSSDDEPLSKHKSLKLILPLKSAIKKNQALPEKQNGRNGPADKKIKSKNCKEKNRRSGSRGRDVWSLMLLHLETMPYKECKGCVGKKRHRFLDPTFTTQALFEDYRKYFLKETNSELGLGFTMYEKYFTKNCNYIIGHLDSEATSCPICEIESTKS